MHFPATELTVEYRAVRPALRAHAMHLAIAELAVNARSIRQLQHTRTGGLASDRLARELEVAVVEAETAALTKSFAGVHFKRVFLFLALLCCVEVEIDFVNTAHSEIVMHLNNFEKTRPFPTS